MNLSKLALRSVSTLALLTTACFAAGCSSTAETGEEDEGALSAEAAALPSDYAFAWDKGQALPEADRWADMYRRGAAIAEGMNAGSETFSFKPKEIGGSSLYAYVDEGAKRHGLWIPPNASTWIVEEIFAFNLSRLFGHGDWAGPASRLTLNGTGSAAYKKMIEGMNVRGIQACNKDHQLKYMAQNPNYFVGIYKEFLPDTKVGDVKGLVKDDGLNASHAVAKFLSNGSRQPTSDAVYLIAKGGTYEIITREDAGYEAAKASHTAESTELEVAQQLNHMMVVDVLNGQRDRYGLGTNMNIFIEKTKGTFRLALIDNGGGSAGIPTKYINDFKNKVTRFDPALAANVTGLDDFLNKKTATSFKNFQDEDSLKRALGYEDVDAVNLGKYSSNCGSWEYPSVGSYKSRWDARWTNFKKGLTLAADHMRANNNPLGQ
ncbi:MAG: hypothetical protein IPG50_35155 [Myxococcales bacterium]|nr:hypothetical protein [Myxococcales bacterium]